jgi:hypothetical protein
MKKRGFITDFFNAANKLNFAPWTNPSTETYYKYSRPTHLFTDLGILNISAPSASMTFNFVENSRPGAPQNLRITNPGSDGANPILQWNANTEPDLNNYRVWRGWTPNWKTTNPTWESNPAATVTGTTWTDNKTTIDLDALSATYYRVTARDNASNESDYSGQAWTTSGPVAKSAKEEQQETLLPESFALHQNYPNPFNPSTDIKYDLPDYGHVALSIFNVVGQKVRTLVDEFKEAGYHRIVWDGKDDLGNGVASGIYLYRIDVASQNARSKSFSAVKKLTLLR